MWNPSVSRPAEQRDRMNSQEPTGIDGGDERFEGDDLALHRLTAFSGFVR
jgi:hypothetical protein